MFIKTTVKTDKKTGKWYNYYRLCATSAAMAMMHITSRAVYPASEQKTARWIKDNSAVANLFNISDNKTLGKTISELSAHTSQTARKPVIVTDAGIMTQGNAKMLKEQGYDYICVNRTKLKDYTTVNPGQENITIYDKHHQD